MNRVINKRVIYCQTKKLRNLLSPTTKNFMQIENFKTLILYFGLTFLISLPAQAQSDSLQSPPLQQEITVGIYQQPPFIIKGSNGTWDGISIRLWRAVAEDLKISYKFLEVQPEQGVNDLTQGKADILLLKDATAEEESFLDFSHIYQIADVGIASTQNVNLGAIAKGFFSKRFWYTAGMLSILLLIVGSIIYFVERGSNEDQFGGKRSIAEGIGSGFWWAGVTMTTIGYGDKAPLTFWGRAVALLWMLVAMAVTAVLTASLVSAVAGTSSNNKINVPDDLRDMKIAAVEGSTAAAYLEAERIPYQKFKEVSKALDEVNKNEVDAVLHSVPELRYEINNDPDLSLKVQPVKIDPKHYAFALDSASTLREPVNQAVLKIINTSLWQQELERFIPE